MTKIMNFSKKSLSIRVILSLCLTFVILVSLVLVNVQTVSAVQVTLVDVPEQMCICNNYMFIANIILETGDYQSITGMQLDISGPIDSTTVFGPEGGIQARNGQEVSGVTPVRVSTWAFSGYGYGGVYYPGGYLTDGYGYGSSSGSQGSLTLPYEIVINTCSMRAGDYTVQLTVTINGRIYSSPEYQFTVTNCGAAAAGGTGAEVTPTPTPTPTAIP